jgi:hypothetical protein
MDELAEVPIPDPKGPAAIRFRRPTGARLQITCGKCGDAAITIEVAAAEPWQDRAVWTHVGPFLPRKLSTPEAWKLFHLIRAGSLAEYRDVFDGAHPGDPTCEDCGEIYCCNCWSIEREETWGGMDVGCGGVISKATCPQGHSFKYQSDGWSYG